MRVVFNPSKPRTTALGFDPAEAGDLFPADDWKYASVEHVYSRTNDLVRSIIDRAPLRGGYKRTLIDVKVQDLTPDIYSCIPGWHLDGAIPGGMEDPDQHHLCVLNGPQTEFIDEPVEIALPTGPITPAAMSLIVDLIPASVKIAAAQEGFITSFTSYDFHRGVRAAAPTRRLLVRLTETNTVQPHNKPRKPSQGARP